MTATISARFLAPILLCAIAATAPVAQVEEITWEDPEIVDVGLPIPSSTSGSSVEHTPDSPPWSNLDEWHVVYTKSDDVYHVVRDSSGWRAPEPLTTVGHARDPKLAFGHDYLFVVWEDDRSGHAEIWTRRWDGTTWSPQMGLTLDDVPSRAPVIVGGVGGTYLAWQEGPDGSRAVVGKPWTGTAWGATESISMSSREAMEPTIAQDAQQQIHVAWTDTRNIPQSEIYLRTRDYSGVWQAETKMTNLPGDCGRPGLHAEYCCGDIVSTEMMLAFENDQTGTTEIYGLCYFPPEPPPEPTLISTADGQSSTRPNIHGFTYAFLGDFFESVYGRYVVSYTNRSAPGAEEHVVVFFTACGNLHDTEILTTSGKSWLLVGAIEGAPDAGVLAVWTEEDGPDDVLLSQVGHTTGCLYPRFPGPGAILLAPGGTPENVIFALDECDDGAPLPGFTVEMFFSNDLDQQLTWDPGQDHPWLGPVETDLNGEAAFPIYGGGCSDIGSVGVRVNGVQILSYPGAKSPDVDGDCLVELEDLIYVDSRIGTDDFCADLNGDFTVDLEDLLIVEEALGDICPSLIGIEEGSFDDGRMPLMTIQPNPCRGRAVIRIEAVDEFDISTRIYDSAGRLVADLETRPHRPGSSVFVWDGRDHSGHSAGSGIYFVVARMDDRVSRRALILVR